MTHKLLGSTSLAIWSLLLTSVACAAGQWTWYGVLVNTKTFNTYFTSTYSKKSDAVGEMKSLGPAEDPYGLRSRLKEQDSPSSMSPNGTTFLYAVPDVPATFSNQYQWSGGIVSNVFSDENSAVQALDSQQGDPANRGCGAPNAWYDPTSDWVPAAGSNANNMGYDRTYQLFGYPSPKIECVVQMVPGGPGAQYLLQRFAVWNCPPGYSISSNNPSNTCVNKDLRGYIVGQLLECPQNGSGSSIVGDPCDVSTGDFFQSEGDFSNSGLIFTRSYHSATLESHHVGTGWTTNYSARLVLSGEPAPIGLVRPDGHHDAVSNIDGEYIADSGSAIHIQKSGSQWIAYLSDGSSEVYDTNGYLLQLVSSGGAVTSLAYNSSGQLTTVSSPFGHSLQLAYDANGNVQQVTDPNGQTISYSYDTNENLTSVTYQDGSTRRYLYEDDNLPNNMTGIIDEAGSRYLTVSYDPATGAVVSSQQAGGVQGVSIRYSSNSAQVTDALGAVTTYSFTNDFGYAPRLTSSTTGALGRSYSVPAGDVDPQRRVTRSVDGNGNITTYTYDTDHLTSKTEADGTASARATTYRYAAANTALPTLISKPLQQIAYTYYPGTNNVNTRAVTDTTGGTTRTWTYSYDGYGHIATEKDPRGGMTTYVYYTCTTGAQCGQLQTTTDAAGHVTTYNSYNAYGQPLTITDPNGVLTTLTYDARQRVTSRKSGAEVTSFTYYPTGLLRTVTLPDSSFEQYTYDDAHRLIQISDRAGNKIAYTLDRVGNRTAESSEDGAGVLHRTHSRVFNTVGQLYQDVNAAGTPGVTTTMGYDSGGNQTSVSAPMGRNTLLAYDALNRLHQITDPVNGATLVTYDAGNNITSVVDPRSLTTSYTYSGFGQPLTQTSPDTGSTRNTYDAVGNLATSTDARGAVASYAYDPLNRPTSVAYRINGATDQAVALTYDAGTNGIGHLTGASDANHSLSWEYDSAGRVTGKTQTVGGVAQAISYAYTNGNLTSITTPGGRTISYGYNGTHQVTSVYVNGIPVLSGAGYEPFGAVDGWTWGNGTGAIRTFDADGDISSITSSSSHSYSYDEARRVTGIADNGNPTLSWNYGYDALDRLSSDSSSSQSQTFTYDANGNRVALAGAHSATYRVDPLSNRLDSISGIGSKTYNYDAAGHTIAYGNLSFTYNAAGRIVTAVNGSTTTMYVYNALGQRVKKVSASGSTLFVYDEWGHLVGEYDSGGAAIQEIVWLGDIPVATVRSEPSGLSIFYIHTDHLNAPRRITGRSTNAVVWSWDGDPFGTQTPDENPSGLGVFSFNLRFPGQYFDAETGLNYNSFRDYDPANGRYVESDPIGLKGGVNTYAYASGNPVSHLDPLGLDCRSGNGAVACQYPGGPAFVLPAPPGFPADISQTFWNLYHNYDVQRSLKCADPQDVLQALINNPTPGNPNPATAGGTPNDAVVVPGISNPVLSYLTTDLNNSVPLVVNITLPNSQFSPGYVAREVIDGIAHTYGEGLNWAQSPGITGPLFQYAANELVWGLQMSSIIKKAKQKCGCQ